MSRLTFITVLSVITLLIAISFQYQQQSTPAPSAKKTPQSAEPDFYLSNTTSIEFDPSGQPRYRFNAKRLEHFPVGDYTLVESPDITLFHDDGTPWYISANQGRASSGNENIKLWDNVVILRDTPKDPLQMNTRTLTIIPTKDMAETKQDIEILGKRGKVEATGMKAYINENRMELLSNVRVWHEPNKNNE